MVSVGWGGVGGMVGGCLKLEVEGPTPAHKLKIRLLGSKVSHSKICLNCTETLVWSVYLFLTGVWVNFGTAMY